MRKDMSVFILKYTNISMHELYINGAYIHAREWMQIKDAKFIISTRILLQEDYLYWLMKRGR